MVQLPQSPREDDMVLGSSHFAPVGGLVLGGIEGLKQQYNHSAVEIRLEAIEKAPQYGEKGLPLLIKGLKDPSLLIQKTAYLHLQQYQAQSSPSHRRKSSTSELIQTALKKYFYYPLLTRQKTLKSGEKCIISGDGNAIAFSTGRNLRVFDLVSKSLLYRVPRVGGRRERFQLGYHSDNLIQITGKKVTLYSEGEVNYSFHRHETEINAIAISQNGELLATASCDRTIQVCSLATGKSLRTFHRNLTSNTHNGQIYHLSFSPSSKTLVSSSEDGTIKLWDLNQEKPRTLKYYGKVVALSPDGLTLAMSDGCGKIKLINLSSGQVFCQLKGHSALITTLQFTAYGRVLMSSGRNGQVKFWNAHSGYEIATLKAHKKAVTAVALRRGKQELLTVGEDKTVKTWAVSHQ